MRTFLCIIALAFMSTIPVRGQVVIPAAERLDAYLPFLKGRKVGVFANQTSMAGQTHLVDTLRKSAVRISVIFGPEHGFRGTADAGEKVGNYVDEQTGVPVVSLYGPKRKPSAEDLRDVDIMLFDIQDVGVRFYTFISSLEEYMESAFINGKPLIILDRPNPNGHYVDGPVLERKWRSFIGMQPVPVVYGMTLGEYAKMLVGEHWLTPEAMKGYAAMQRSGIDPLRVIPCANYTHHSVYSLPVRPSPNLPDMSSIYWYPSTCFFEGTVLSEGRGTKAPFQIFGHPSLPKDLYAFTPTAMFGANAPKLKDQQCYGWNLADKPEQVRQKIDGKLRLSYLMEAYRLFPEKDKFFLLPKSGDATFSFFNKLAGNADLMEQIKTGKNEEEIRASWQPGLADFRKIREKYLIYP